MIRDTSGHASDTRSGIGRAGAGVDLVSVRRVEGLLARWGDRFLRRIYTDGEIAYCKSRAVPARSFAARFAAKEAFFKAVSPQPTATIGHRDVEVIVDEAGVPAIRPHGHARRALGDREAALSLSHELDLAIAIVVALPALRERRRRPGEEARS